jgi:hypothetical protein
MRNEPRKLSGRLGESLFSQEERNPSCGKEVRKNGFRKAQVRRKGKIVMCGRYRRTTSEEELARLYRIPIPPQTDLPISWNIAPS